MYDYGTILIIELKLKSTTKVKDAAFLVMSTLSITSKLVLALAYCIPIISIDCLESMAADGVCSFADS